MTTVRSSRILRIIPFLIAVCLAGSPARAQYGGGSGEPNDPYLIYTHEQMNSIGAEPNDWNKHFKLMADIDLSIYKGTDFNIIGRGFEGHPYRPFKGVFDGNNHIISNFSYTSADEGTIALFGLISRGEIRDLGLVDPNVSADAGWRVGSLVAHSNGTVTACYVVGGSVSGRSGVGGLAGINSGTITDCYSTGVVRGDDKIGGLAGANYGTLTGSYSTSTVTGAASVGGLAGENAGTITCSYATGQVDGAGAAGLVGINEGRILFSYSAGRVAGGPGLANGGSVYLCHWDIETTRVADGVVGKGMTTSQMKDASTYRGWGYEGKWLIDDGNDYPRLVWQDTPGQLLVDPPRSYGGGTGEPNYPYIIRTVQELASIHYYREDFSKHFMLANDIDLMHAPEEIAPIGISGIPFTGSFLGNGHAIMNFSRKAAKQNYAGLFGYIDQSGHVEGLHLLNASVTGSQYAGGLAGYNRGTIRQCSVTGTVEGHRWVGGLVGFDAGPVTNCSAQGRVSGSQHVGGLVGGLYGRSIDAPIVACFSDSTVVGETSVGGLVGLNAYPLSPPYGQAGPPPGDIPYPPRINISSCYSTGYVEGRERVGGLVGENGGSIQFSYSAGRVVDTNPSSDEQSFGGLVGRNNYGVVLLSYWDAEASGQSYSAAGKGKTTEQMMSDETFSGWDYGGQWVIDRGNDYPRLAWAGFEGEPIVDAPKGYAGGAGEPDDPYRIHTADELIALARHPGDWDRHFVLTADIDLSDVDPNLVSPIGVYGTPFTGVFDGNNCTISNYRYVSDTESFLGVFGSIGPEVFHGPYGYRLYDPNNSGSVMNLNLEDLQILAYCCAGGLAGYNSGTISNCSVAGSVEAILKNAGGLSGYSVGKITDCNAICSVKSEEFAGGLIACNQGPVTACSASGSVEATGTHARWCAGGLIGHNTDVIESCHFDGTITGFYNIGGLIGHNVGSVTDCSASGNVTGTWDVGGLVGENGYGCAIATSFSDGSVTGEERVGGLIGNNSGVISNCYARGSVDGVEQVAGLTGWTQTHSQSITLCYSSCTVTGQQETAGLVGSDRKSNDSNSFWDVETSGQITSAGGTGKTTAEMQTAAAFLEAGWDFVGE
ncbi:MAG: GLUG motif-containing protein, partial [Planctomycetota bacterium]